MCPRTWIINIHTNTIVPNVEQPSIWQTFRLMFDKHLHVYQMNEPKVVKIFVCQQCILVYMTILYALLVLLVAVLVTTITSLYDRTI